MPKEVIKKNIILLGDGAVGKTSLNRRFVLEEFSDKYITTIGTKVTKKEIYLGNGDEKTEVVLTHQHPRTFHCPDGLPVDLFVHKERVLFRPVPQERRLDIFGYKNRPSLP